MQRRPPTTNFAFATKLTQTADRMQPFSSRRSLLGAAMPVARRSRSPRASQSSGFESKRDVGASSRSVVRKVARRSVLRARSWTGASAGARDRRLVSSAGCWPGLPYRHWRDQVLRALPQYGGEGVVLRLRARQQWPLLFEVPPAQLAGGGSSASQTSAPAPRSGKRSNGPTRVRPIRTSAPSFLPKPERITPG